MAKGALDKIIMIVIAGIFLGATAGVVLNSMALTPAKLNGTGATGVGDATVALVGVLPIVFIIVAILLVYYATKQKG